MNTLQFIKELDALKVKPRTIIDAAKEEYESDKMIDIIDELTAIKQSIKEREIIANTEFTPHYYETTMCK